jgi:hypothetical protein
MSDTPETDAAADWYLAAAYSTDPEDRTVPLAVSRKLERERNEWAKLCGQYKQERDEARIQEDMHFQNFLQMRRERDEAREALANVEEYGTEEINTAVRLRRKLATALVERDEARELNSKLRDIAERAINDFNGCKARQLRAELDQLKEGAK